MAFDNAWPPPVLDPDGPAASRNSAELYRRQQADLIAQGRFRDAQQMDIDNLRQRFGDKYDDAIQQMLEYTQTLGY